MKDRFECRECELKKIFVIECVKLEGSLREFFVAERIEFEEELVKFIFLE